MSKSNTHRLALSATLLGIALVLTIASGFVPLQLPFGGGITLASMVPIVILAYLYGVKWGMGCAFLFSILQMLTGMSTISAYFLPGEGQMVLTSAILITLIDYLIAYTVLGLAGIFKGRLGNKPAEIALGSVLALSLRYIAHFVSGVIFWGSYAEWFFGQETLGDFGSSVLSTFTGTDLAVVYSAFYNGTYMIPEIIITAVVAPIIFKVLDKTKV